MEEGVPGLLRDKTRPSRIPPLGTDVARIERVLPCMVAPYLVLGAAIGRPDVQGLARAVFAVGIDPECDTDKPAGAGQSICQRGICDVDFSFAVMEVEARHERGCVGVWTMISASYQDLQGVTAELLHGFDGDMLRYTCLASFKGSVAASPSAANGDAAGTNPADKTARRFVPSVSLACGTRGQRTRTNPGTSADRHSTGSGIHRIKEVIVRLAVFQLVQQELHRIHGAHRVQDTAQHPHLR